VALSFDFNEFDDDDDDDEEDEDELSDSNGANDEDTQHLVGMMLAFHVFYSHSGMNVDTHLQKHTKFETEKSHMNINKIKSATVAVRQLNHPKWTIQLTNCQWKNDI